MKHNNHHSSLLPDFIVSVGVTGHRNLSPQFYPAIEHAVSEILSQVMVVSNQIYSKAGHIYSKTPPVYRMVSPLAEGADRIVASAAIQCGFKLQCPLPLRREEYEKDFKSEESRNEFRNLLNKADSVYEIAFESPIRNSAYLDAGEVVLNHSDLLISVWDGEENNAVGGTGNIVAKAKELGIPILWIRSADPGIVALLYDEDQCTDWKGSLGVVMHKLLSPELEECVFPEVFSDKVTRIRSYAILNRWFTKFILKISPPKYGKKYAVPDMAGSTDSTQPLDEDYYPPNFKTLYQHLDALAVYYAEHFRTVGLMRQLLPFFATLALGVGFYWNLVGINGTVDVLGFLFQAVFIYMIVWITRINRIKKWHTKFTDYRLIAELLRQMVYLYPLGSIVRNIRTPVYQNQNSSNWVNWYYKSIVRQAGIPNVKYEQKNLNICKTNLTGILNNQILYHSNTIKKHGTIAIFLEKNGLLFYYIGLAITFLRVLAIYGTNRFAHNSGPLYMKMPEIFNMLSMVIPAVATAFFGIAAQGHYQQLEQRSAGMVELLSSLKRKLEKTETVTYQFAKNIAGETARLMISEVLDWNVFIKHRGVSKQ